MMTSPTPEPQQPPEKVVRAAESNNLGGFERTLLRGTGKRMFADAVVTSRVHDFKEGIIYEGTDGVLYVFPWNKITTVYLASTRHFVNGSYTGTSYGADVFLAQGGRLSLHGRFQDPVYSKRVSKSKKQATLDEYEVYLLMLDAQRAASEAQLPGTLARLQEGKELTFGDITISLAGVRTAKGLVPWDAIRDFQIRNGVVQVKQDGKFFPISRQSVGQIPNLPLFSLLAKALRSGQQRQ